MFLKKTKRPNGRIFLEIVESVHVSGVGSTHVLVEKIGFLDQLVDTYPDPIAFFSNKAREMTENKKKSSKILIEIDSNEKMPDEYSNSKNVGYVILNELYSKLKLKQFWKKKASSLKIQYDLEAIFRLLVFSRILYPGSKKFTFDNRSEFFEPFDFTLKDVYRALEVFAQEEESLQKWIFEHSTDICHRDLSHTYFDCTNYYFEIEYNDEDLIDEEGNIIEKKYRKRGPEKNHRPDPIIELGLFMDADGLPLSYTLFPGNESEKVQLRPFLARSRKDFNISRTVVVADRGLNTSDNIYYLAGKNDKNLEEEHNLDGYIYGQSVRGADQEFKDWILNTEDYEHTILKPNENSSSSCDDDDILFIHKSRIYPKKIQINREKKNGKMGKATITVTQKQMVYFSKKYARRQAHARNQMIERAKDLINHPKKYNKVFAKGAAGYVVNLQFDEETGEVIAKNLRLDQDKIDNEAKLDGYYSIVTSELDMSDIELRDKYRGLARIEDTFKVTKSNLESRPVFVWTTDSIKAHFMTCFTSLVIIRLLERLLNEQYSTESIITALKKYMVSDLGGNCYQMLNNSKIIMECSQLFDLNLENKVRSRREMRTLLKY